VFTCCVLCLLHATLLQVYRTSGDVLDLGETLLALPQIVARNAQVLSLNCMLYTARLCCDHCDTTVAQLRDRFLYMCELVTSGP
jgi:hypothetical protein